jgi:hypothetical protein
MLAPGNGCFRSAITKPRDRKSPPPPLPHQQTLFSSGNTGSGLFFFNIILVVPITVGRKYFLKPIFSQKNILFFIYLSTSAETK